MSRAFVKEQDNAEPLLRPEPELPAGVRNHVTPAGAARFRARREALLAERAQLGEGGLSDARRREIDGEVRWLERRMATFVETAPPADPQRVGFGTAVTLLGEKGERTLGIVGVDEVDVARGWVSWLSPVARALHGAQVGDLVTVKTPAGDEEWEVLAIAPLSEDAPTTG